MSCGPEASSALSPTIVGAMIAFVGTIAGAGVTGYGARRRERRAQKLDWNRRLFDKYADSYRDFLATWGGAANAVMLEAAFGELRRAAFVPAGLVSDYEEALQGIRSAERPSEREMYAKGLRNSVEVMLNDPLGLVGR